MNAGDLTLRYGRLAACLSGKERMDLEVAVAAAAPGTHRDWDDPITLPISHSLIQGDHGRLLEAIRTGSPEDLRVTCRKCRRVVPLEDLAFVGWSDEHVSYSGASWTVYLGEVVACPMKHDLVVHATSSYVGGIG